MNKQRGNVSPRTSIHPQNTYISPLIRDRIVEGVARGSGNIHSVEWRAVYGRPLTPPGQITRFSRDDFPAARPPNKKTRCITRGTGMEGVVYWPPGNDETDGLLPRERGGEEVRTCVVVVSSRRRKWRRRRRKKRGRNGWWSGAIIGIHGTQNPPFLPWTSTDFITREHTSTVPSLTSSLAIELLNLRLGRVVAHSGRPFSFYGLYKMCIREF